MADAWNRHVERVAALRRAVFDSPAETDPAVRRAAGQGEPLLEPWGRYAAPVRDASYRLSDADIAALRAGGCSEEAIFELTIAAATGAALRRLDAGLRAIQGTRWVRLGVLERGHERPARLFIRLVELVSRQRMDNVVLTVLHRPEFWGRPFSALLTEVMRGPSFWTAGEREYLAMTVSRLNECPFCVAAHTETTRIESRGEVGVDGGAMRREMVAVLPFLEKVTTAPDAVTPDGVAPVRAAGVPDEAIVDALHVALIFNSVNRMANAFGWSWNSDRHVQVAAAAIHRIRYKPPGFVMR